MATDIMPEPIVIQMPMICVESYSAVDNIQVEAGPLDHHRSRYPPIREFAGARGRPFDSLSADLSPDFFTLHPM